MIYFYPLTILATLFAVFVTFYMAFNVGRMRKKYDVKAPATTGHIEFEKAYRVHANTVEQIVLFLPVLWLFSLMVGDIAGGLIGLAWPVGRWLYGYQYSKAPEKRSFGFLLTIIPTIVLFFGSLISLGMNYFKM